MTAALLLLGAALVTWPGNRALLRARRVASVRPPWRTPWSVPAASVPLLCGVAAAAGGALLSTPLVAGLAGVVASLAARAGERRRAGNREEARVLALAEALGALAAELRSGRSLEGATAAAVTACADADSGRALARAVRAPTAPAPADAGLLGDALERVSAATLLSQRSGCSLAAVVGAVEDDLRARRRYRLDLRAATAGSRASTVLLAGLPLLALAMGGGVGADPWRVLTTTGTGQVLLVAGVGLEVAGLAWSDRLVSRAVR
ncbi:type II secretion system F family protein [Geodermatophilus sp. CPCC 205506]|uniref:type II secretion system F family protein n=1 Tax=Geodermatophilus sp. CPCC 205506 TaxID=2936596 RepID=UPI003EEABFE6